jgi:two-component system LytT family response regulator
VPDVVRALIVDDEALARERIRSLLRDRGDVEVVGEAADGMEAVAAIQVRGPDLVFLDVQMPEMDGFEVLAALDEEHVPAVIFVTAFDRYALKAFEVHALDYLLKPFDRARFSESVDRAVSRLTAARGLDARTQLLDILEELRSQGGTKPLRRFVSRSQGRIRFVMAEDVEWIEAEGNYVALHVGADSHLIRGTMKRMEESLDPRRFLRVHRSAIVNLDRVNEIQPWFNGDFVMLTESGHEVTTGETYRARIQELIRNPL